MYVSYSHTFKKMFRKLPTQLQDTFEKRLSLFLKNPHDPALRVHALEGAWRGCFSINITGDIRAAFEEVSDDHVEFVAIGSHSELYS